MKKEDENESENEKIPRKLNDILIERIRKYGMQDISQLVNGPNDEDTNTSYLGGLINFDGGTDDDSSNNQFDYNDFDRNNLVRILFEKFCEENGIKKDDPEFFGKVCALLGTEKENTAVVDDALHCIESAKGAGFFTAAVFDSGNADWKKTSETADIAADDLRGFTEFIKAQRKGDDLI